MRGRQIIIAGVILFGAGSSLQAQEAAPVAAYVEVKEGAVTVPELGLSVEQIEDLNVYDADGNIIGDVEDVLGTSPGAPVAIAVDADRYLGAEGNDVVIGFGQLKYDAGKLLTSLSKAEIGALPRFND